MHNLSELEKKQIGLRLNKYLVDEIDEFTDKYSVNRTDVIVEAIKSYLSAQKEKEFYDNFDKACKEINAHLNDTEKKSKLQSLEEFINENENISP